MNDLTYEQFHLPIIRFTNSVLLVFLIIFSQAQASVLGFVEYEPSESVTTDITMPPMASMFILLTLVVVGMSWACRGHVVGNDGPIINTYTRDPETGSLELANAFRGGEDFDETFSFLPKGLVASPDNKQVYVIGRFDGGALIHFSRNTETGELTYVSKVELSETISTGLDITGSLEISTDGFFIYVGTKTKGVAIFKREGNVAISFVEAIDRDAHGDDIDKNTYVSLSPDGKNLYASSNRGQFYVFSRNETTGQLTAQQTFKDKDHFPSALNGTLVDGLFGSEVSIVANDGRFVYVTRGKIDGETGNGNDDQHNVVTFQRSLDDGALTFVENTTNTVESIFQY